MELAYSKEVWFAVFGEYNNSIWPAILVFYALFALALWGNLAQSQSRVGRNFLPLVLVSAWVWTGIGFYAIAFASYDFLAPFESGFWVAQALVLLADLWFRGGFVSGRTASFQRWAGLSAIAFGLMLIPILDLAAGVQAGQLRWFGVAPGPTLIASLGVFLLVRARWYLWLLPLLWSIKAGLVAWSLGIFQDLIVPVVGFLLAAIGCLSTRANRRT